MGRRGRTDRHSKKLAGLSILSNELVNDSDPSALQVVGDGLVRDLRTRLDAAYFGTTVANAPDGIQALAGVTTVTGGTITNLDAFADAVSKAEVVWQHITSWVAHPNTVLTLMKLKDEANSNRPLLGTDPSQPAPRTAPASRCSAHPAAHRTTSGKSQAPQASSSSGCPSA